MLPPVAPPRIAPPPVGTGPPVACCVAPLLENVLQARHVGVDDTITLATRLPPCGVTFEIDETMPLVVMLGAQGCIDRLQMLYNTCAGVLPLHDAW